MRQVQVHLKVADVDVQVRVLVHGPGRGWWDVVTAHAAKDAMVLGMMLEGASAVVRALSPTRGATGTDADGEVQEGTGGTEVGADAEIELALVVVNRGASSKPQAKVLIV